MKKAKGYLNSAPTLILLPALVVIIFGGCRGNDTVYPPLDKQKAALRKMKKIPAPRKLDSIQIVNDLEFLASDSCEGRQPGLKGHALAMHRITLRMRQAGLDSFNASLFQHFLGRKYNGTTAGENVVGWIKGTVYPDKYIVISAHYDHIGIGPGNDVYNGASDNASGTACLLALANYYQKHPHPYSLIFAAFDREEMGFEGALFFVEHAKTTHIVFNLNLDMITRSDQNELFASGLSHYPSFAYLVDKIQPVTTTNLLKGHDSGEGREDWTRLSDHYAFHEKKIPFLYLGTEDHPDYHQPTDSFEKIDLASYIENCNLILAMIEILAP